jgi:hypothetical protein
MPEVPFMGRALVTPSGGKRQARGGHHYPFGI